MLTITLYNLLQKKEKLSINFLSSIFKFIFCLLFITILSENAFCQSNGLLLAPEDIRLDSFYMNGEIVYILLVRKKQNIESVMLTEPTGLYALRSMEWNSINGDERRELSQKVINDTYSRFSILSSTPIPDRQFGRAFQLLIPSKIVYGNPSSSAGVVFMNRNDVIKINIRTFNHKYADPNKGRFQDNTYIINDMNMSHPERDLPHTETTGTVNPLTLNKESLLKSELERIRVDQVTLDKMDDEELEKFLREAFLVKKYEKKEEK